jgi:hypothetical protein
MFPIFPVPYNALGMGQARFYTFFITVWAR